MREILFRGKRIDNGEWVEGGYRHEKIGEYYTSVFIVKHLTSGVWENHRVVPATVGQYTGLTDKNGKKIFEGDIVNFSDNLYYIIFVDGCFRICRNRQYSYTLHNLHSAFEIIGNIHDNPGLLKGGEG